LAVRTASDPLSSFNVIRTAILAVDPELPVSDISSMSELVHQSVSRPRQTTLLLSCFAIFALLLSATGVYSVMFYAVAERTREIGLRMALGAERQNILRMIMSHGMALVLIGLGVGLTCAYGVTRWMSSFLFEVKSTDPLTFFAVGAILAATGFIACFIPAYRATKVDPLIALRYE
jgi:ABC-type antimicrobial peptide transport system permease subunit